MLILSAKIIKMLQTTPLILCFLLQTTPLFLEILLQTTPLILEILLQLHHYFFCKLYFC